MNNLIKNEFTKLFKKKSTYIILIITLAYMLLCNFMTKNSEKQMYDTGYTDDLIQSYEKSMPSSNDPETNSMYIDMKSQLDIIKLSKKYGYNSWQTYVIENVLNGSGYIRTMNEYNYGIPKTVSIKDYNLAKANYDNFIQKLDSGDWKYFVHSELDDVNRQIDAIKNNPDANNHDLKNLEIEKQVLVWRIEKNISYEQSFLNTCLKRYLSNSETVSSYESSTKHSYSEKQEYYEALETMNTCKYYVENNISNISDTDNRSILLDLLDNYEIFILIFVIMIAGSIVSDEFSKGTIKLLLVRPYNRMKILLSKFIVCIMVLVLFVAFVAVSQFIIGGIIQGFDSTLVPVVVYNHHTNQVETMNIASYIFITFLAKSPVYILLMTLAFACSTIFTNTAVSIVLPLLGYIGSPIINQLALLYDFKEIIYFVTPNWDFTQYLFGGLPQFEAVSLPFSIIVCLVYFAIMVVAAFTVFKKRNIKNI